MFKLILKITYQNVIVLNDQCTLHLGPLLTNWQKLSSVIQPLNTLKSLVKFGFN